MVKDLISSLVYWLNRELVDTRIKVRQRIEIVIYKFREPRSAGTPEIEWHCL